MRTAFLCLLLMGCAPELRPDTDYPATFPRQLMCEDCPEYEKAYHPHAKPWCGLNGCSLEQKHAHEDRWFK